jgi:hypothetical protein
MSMDYDIIYDMNRRRKIVFLDVLAIVEIGKYFVSMDRT